MTSPTKPEAEQGTEVREFRVTYEFEGPADHWSHRTRHLDQCVDIAAARSEVGRWMGIGFGEGRRNVRIETRTITTSSWSPVPEEKP